jgi:lactoylglutathione lyase
MLHPLMTTRGSFPRALAATLMAAAIAAPAHRAVAQDAAPISFGYTILWVKDVDKAAAFYEKAFRFAVKRRQDMGAFKWLEMSTGATTLAFAGDAEIKGMFPAGYAGHDLANPPVAAQVSFITPDVQRAFDQAVAAGAMAIRPPAKMPWGQTWAQLRDPNGVLVSIASTLQ